MDNSAPENAGIDDATPEDNVAVDDGAADDSSADDIALDEALSRLAKRVSTLSAAFDTFSDRQERLVGRDYSDDLSKIDESWKKAREAFRRLADRPALALTPETMAGQMKAAGQKLHEDEHRALREARSHLDDAVSSIKTVVGSARTEEKQNFWIAVIAGVAAVLAFVAGCTVPQAIDRAVPDHWLWPEKRAAAQLERGMWEAGVHLLQVADPDRWNALARTSMVYRDNEKSLAKCEQQARRKKAAVSCMVKIEAPAAG